MPLVIESADNKVLGYVEWVELNDGTYRIAGWASVPKIQIASEAQSTEVHTEIPREDLAGLESAFGFECIIAGCEYLSVSGGEGKPLRIVLPRTGLQAAAAWRRTLFIAVSLPFTHYRDILGWFLRGDSEAGTRLERVLIPLKLVQWNPIAIAGIFASEPVCAFESSVPVDICIPVYNAPDDLEACLMRVDRFTGPLHRVILVDDGSTDPRIAPLLARFAKRRGNVEVLANARNLGFVASVNRALTVCRGDVVLLNSDAMVSDHWLDRLMAPILSDPAIASVTPMTNNGEIASVPVICKAHDLPVGDVDRINAAAARLDPLQALVDVPTGVGFCMAMSQHWRARVAGFDEVFGRGYGEEVDWCRKVAAMGGRHVLTGAVFVEHRGGMSFGPEKARRIAENNRIISRRYPGFDASVAQFIGRDPAVGPRLALGLAAAAQQDRPVSIYLGHRLGGGAEHWLIEEIAAQIDLGQSVAVLRDGDVPDSLLFELHTPEGVTTGQVPLQEVPLYLAGPARRRLVYSNLVAARAPLDLLARVVAALTPDDEFCIVFHDFLPLCPSYNLISTHGSFCGLPTGPSCQRCYGSLATTSGQRPGTIAEWRQAWRQFLDRATGIVVFSDDSRRQVARVWPDLEGRIAVIPHRPQHLPARLSAPPRGRLTIGVLGGIGYSKGAKILHDLAACMAPDVDIVVIGKIDPDYTHSRITVHGPYERDRIGALAESYRVGCWLIPSIWPETFCYAAHEALATGLPVFVYDLGAQAIAAAAAENGHLLPPGCEGAALEQYLRDHGFGTREDRANREEAAARTGRQPVKTANGAARDKA